MCSKHTPGPFFSRGSTISNTTCISSSSWGSPHTYTQNCCKYKKRQRKHFQMAPCWRQFGQVCCHLLPGGICNLLQGLQHIKCRQPYLTHHGELHDQSVQWKMKKGNKDIRTNQTWNETLASQWTANSIKGPEAVSQWPPCYLIFVFPFIPEFDGFFHFVPHMLSLQLYYVSQTFHSPFRKA